MIHNDSLHGEGLASYVITPAFCYGEADARATNSRHPSADGEASPSTRQVGAPSTSLPAAARSVHVFRRQHARALPLPPPPLPHPGRRPTPATRLPLPRRHGTGHLVLRGLVRLEKKLVTLAMKPSPSTGRAASVTGSSGNSLS